MFNTFCDFCAFCVTLSYYCASNIFFVPFRLFAHFRNPIPSRKWTDYLSRKTAKNSDFRENCIAPAISFLWFLCFLCDLILYCASNILFRTFSPFRVLSQSHHIAETVLLLIAKNCEKLRLTRKLYCSSNILFCDFRAFCVTFPRAQP